MVVTVDEPRKWDILKKGWKGDKTRQKIGYPNSAAVDRPDHKNALVPNPLRVLVPSSLKPTETPMPMCVRCRRRQTRPSSVEQKRKRTFIPLLTLPLTTVPTIPRARPPPPGRIRFPAGRSPADGRRRRRSSVSALRGVAAAVGLEHDLGGPAHRPEAAAVVGVGGGRGWEAAVACWRGGRREEEGW
jgi:hypothetical protein